MRERSVKGSQKSRIMPSGLGVTSSDKSGVPYLIAPSNGIVNYSGDLIWNCSYFPLGSLYELQVNTSPDFTGDPLLIPNPLTISKWTIAGAQQDTQYYWRVRSIIGGNFSQYSEVWSFQSIHIPVPILTNPANGAVNFGGNLTWDVVAPPVGSTYELLINTASDFTGTFVTVPNPINGFSYPLTGHQSDTTYYWKVRTLSPLGNSNYSLIRSFTSLAIPAPTLISPSDGALSFAGDLSWTHASPPVGSTYRLEVNTQADFMGTALAAPVNTTSTTWTLNGESVGTHYYWRVMLQTPMGNSPYSSVWSFTTATYGGALNILINRHLTPEFDYYIKGETPTYFSDYAALQYRFNTFDNVLFSPMEAGFIVKNEINYTLENNNLRIYGNLLNTNLVNGFFPADKALDMTNLRHDEPYIGGTIQPTDKFLKCNTLSDNIKTLFIDDFTIINRFKTNTDFVWTSPDSGTASNSFNKPIITGVNYKVIASFPYFNSTLAINGGDPIRLSIFYTSNIDTVQLQTQISNYDSLYVGYPLNGTLIQELLLEQAGERYIRIIMEHSDIKFKPLSFKIPNTLLIFPDNWYNLYVIFDQNNSAFKVYINNTFLGSQQIQIKRYVPTVPITPEQYNYELVDSRFWPLIFDELVVDDYGKYYSSGQLYHPPFKLDELSVFQRQFYLTDVNYHYNSGNGVPFSTWENADSVAVQIGALPNQGNVLINTVLETTIPNSGNITNITRSVDGALNIAYEDTSNGLLSYNPNSDVANLVGGAIINKNLDIYPKVGPTTLIINLNPPTTRRFGTKVWIDGVYVTTILNNQSSKTFTINPGDHKVELRARHYKFSQNHINITAQSGDTITINATITPADYQVQKIDVTKSGDFDPYWTNLPLVGAYYIRDISQDIIGRLPMASANYITPLAYSTDMSLQYTGNIHAEGWYLTSDGDPNKMLLTPFNNIGDIPLVLQNDHILELNLDVLKKISIVDNFTEQNYQDINYIKLNSTTLNTITNSTLFMKWDYANRVAMTNGNDLISRIPALQFIPEPTYYLPNATVTLHVNTNLPINYGANVMSSTAFYSLNVYDSINLYPDVISDKIYCVYMNLTTKNNTWANPIFSETDTWGVAFPFKFFKYSGTVATHILGCAFFIKRGGVGDTASATQLANDIINTLTTRTYLIEMLAPPTSSVTTIFGVPVIDDATREVLTGVQVKVNNINMKMINTVTDYLIFGQLPAGQTYNFTFEKAGYTIPPLNNVVIPNPSHPVSLGDVAQGPISAISA